MTVPPYRCVFLNSDGVGLAAIELVSDDEATAVALAADVANPNGLELWDGPILVKRLPPRASAGSYGAPRPSR